MAASFKIRRRHKKILQRTWASDRIARARKIMIAKSQPQTPRLYTFDRVRIANILQSIK